MEGERRKRKIENEEENEEQKMERFFALIKRTKDVRDRLYKEKTDNKKMDEERERSIWNPKFEVEDFIDCGDMPNSSKVSGPHHHDLAGPSRKELIDKKEDFQEATELVPAEVDNDGEKDKISEHLNLNLSL